MQTRTTRRALPAKRSVHLPRSVAGGLLYNMDWTLVTCLTAVCLLHVGVVVWLHASYAPELAQPQLVDSGWLPIPKTLPSPHTRLLRQVRHLGEKPIPARKTKPKGTSGPRRAHRAPGGGASIAERVRGMGVLQLLTHKGRGPSLVRDLLNNGKSDTQLARAFRGLKGTTVASTQAGPGLRTRGSHRLEAAGVGDLGARITGPDGVRSGDAVRERVPRALVRPAQRSSNCPLPEPHIMPVVRRGLPAIRACYERELRRNSELQGKVALRITINTMGRVRGVDIDQDTLGGGSGVARCMASHVRRWRFPPIKEGATEVVLPFVLRRGR